MNTPTQTFTDEPTRIRLVAEYDIDNHPMMTVYIPDGYTMSLEELNRAMGKLTTEAGLFPLRQYLEGKEQA